MDKLSRLPTLILPAVSIVAFHWVIPDVLVGYAAREDLHFPLLGQRKEAFGLVHDFTRIFLIDALGMPGQLEPQQSIYDW